MLPTSTMKRGRSKTGCNTCRLKKVKCDEKQPMCARCIRLNFECGWPGPGPPLKLKRRGHGPLKSRDHSWVPKQIVPALLTSPLVLTALISKSTTSSTNPEEPCSDEWVGSDEWWESIGIEGQNLDWRHLPINYHNTESFSAVIESSDSGFNDFEDVCFTTSDEAARSSTTATLVLSPGQTLSDYHFTVPNSLTLSPSEHQALNHYQTVFSLYRSTKDPKWSTHKMLLNYGSYDPMIMHFILAVSMNDFSLRLSDEDAYQGAQTHFETGSRLWIETMTKNDPSDHLALMTSFFFLYLYMTKRENVPHQRLQKLSKSVTEFVRRHKLDTRCLGSTRSLTPDEIIDDSAAMTIRQRSLLARLIMWTFDEDVKCGFQGSGGHFAQYLSENDARTKNIYDASRSVLENHWGAYYPDYQVFDDNENSVILEFLFAMMPLQHDINDLSKQDSDSAEICRRIQRKFAMLEQDYSSVFRIARTKTLPRSRVLVNADYDVVLFNALKIYYFRSTIVDLTIDTPQEVSQAMKSLLSIVQQTFASNGTELHERLQWPLFLAGIETDDTIYREWVLSKLTSYRVLGALKSTLEAQQQTGQRLRMTEIRDIVHAGEEHNLIMTSQTAFLDAIPAFGVCWQGGESQWLEI